MRVISVIQLKGGTGKSTTAENLAYCLGELEGKRVLVIDNDKQGNTSKVYGCYDPKDKNTIARLMEKECVDVKEVIKKTRYENIDIIAANMYLGEENWKAMKKDDGEYTVFEEVLERVKGDYDYCVFDNAPDINTSIIYALAMTNDVVIPVVTDAYSLDGLEVLESQLEDVRQINNGLENVKCLITMYENTEVGQQTEEYVRSQRETYKQKIRRSGMKAYERSFVQEPLVKYSVRCGAAQDYKKFTKEYLKDIEG